MMRRKMQVEMKVFKQNLLLKTVANKPKEKIKRMKYSKC